MHGSNAHWGATSGNIRQPSSYHSDVNIEHAMKDTVRRPSRTKGQYIKLQVTQYNNILPGVGEYNTLGE
jgi:hypothetical protein